MNKPVETIIVGAGHRALLYASLALKKPELMRVVGVADPSKAARDIAVRTFGIPESMCWESAEALAGLPRQADAIINGTMDNQHVPTSLPLLERGYHILLEKPFAVNETEMEAFIEAVEKAGVVVNICHVLRYTPFYRSIYDVVRGGSIGEVITIHASEHISYHHMAVSFVRGKWGNKDISGSSMIMAKCCHDLDLLVWLQKGLKPKVISSSGSLQYFTEKNAPVGSGEKCLLDCTCESECLYSARKHYLDHPDRWSFYVWDELKHIENPSIREKEALLKGDSPYGRCVFRSNNTVVDHQHVIIEFENGSTGSLDMVGGCVKSGRKIHIIGSKGEIEGIFEDGSYVVRLIDPSPGCEFEEHSIDVRLSGDFSGVHGGHGGGDLRLVEDFIKTIRGEASSVSSTSLSDSIVGHRIGFLAEKARLANQTIVM